MRIVGIMLVVFIKEEHTNHLFDVMGATVGTGLMGMMVSIFTFERKTYWLNYK